ncbi:putative uncharacterized protein DDB_G0282133 [Acyrthosiphon pisum]|uniref:Uncharacterized protein n=1 Tax=Acyrthosiphon pisum TaxID=7029 RepID=A0A8R2A3K6_ACYPI|nr:putative uncharacterized protein DDB_G0282133 [Acyrthosiphon pisum]|eukprot:XP_001945753.2 PREDICTED: putative uncharacterized protein DDB_G0282133 [Acyrthosiphon pisum]
MESSIPNTSTSSAKSVALSYEMDSSNEEIDQQVLREAGEQTINAEWSATVSALNSSDTTSSNSYINIETLKECCANPSDTLKDKEDFMVIESSSTVVNISKFNDTKYYSECKTTAFQKKHKPLSQNVSRCFENILDDDSQMEITQSSICLNRFQKRKRLMPPNDEDFIEINNSNYSGSNSMEVSMMKSPKFSFSRKKKDQFEIPDYNLSATDNDSIANETNISKRKENASNCSLVVNDSSNNMKNASRTEVLTHKFSLKTIGVADSVFENIINNSSIISDITLNSKKTSLNDTTLSNVNNTSVFSKMDLSNLNHTYDIPNNTNSTSIKASIAGDANIPQVKQNTVFKKPSNLSILVNDSSNNIMDVSKTEVLAQKFSRKSIHVPDSAFDNIIDDSSMTSNIGLNNMKTSLNETSVSNINNSKMDMSHLNYTYDIPTNINTPKIDVIIAGEANIPKVKQNTDFKKPSNSSIVVNDSSNNIIDVSKTEVLTHKFNRKTIDVADSVFENIINNSSITSDITLHHNHTFSNEPLVLNVNNPVLNKIDVSNLNHTYDIPTNNTSTIDIPITGDANIPKVKQNTDLKKPSYLSIVVNDSSNNVMDVSKPEVLTHKFSRKTIDVTHSVFDNIINDSSMTSDITLSNKKVSLIETSVSNDNSPVFSTTDVSNSNHTYDIPMNNSTTLLDAIVEHDKNMSETPISFQNNRSKSFNLRPLKFNFSNKFGRHSLSLQENSPRFDGVKQHNISLNTDFSKNSGEESNTFLKSANNSNVNLKSHPHFSIIREISPLDDPLLTNTLNQEQLQSNHSIISNSNNKDFLLSNTTNKSLESNEFQKNQSKHSMSSTSSNEGLTLLNSTSGLLGSYSSSRTQSRLLTSKQSKSSTSTNNTLNLSIESLDKSQNDQSKHLISSTSNNEDLTLTNSTTGFSGRRCSSRNKSTSSEHSTSVISNHDSLTSLNATTEVSVGGRLSRNRSQHSTSVVSNNDNLTLLNTTMESLKSNESQKTQSKHSISPTSYNESLKSTNSTAGSSGRRSSSRNKSSSTSSSNATSAISINDSVASLNDSNEMSVSGRSSRNQSKHSTSVISNNDNLTLLNTTMESLKSNESQKTQSKHSISPTSYNESLKSTNSTAGSSGRRSSSRNKSSSTSSSNATSAISINDSVASLNDSNEMSVSGRSSRNQSKHSTSVISNNDNLTLLNTTMESLKSNESQKTQSKHSISPTSYNESLKSTNSTAGSSGRRSSSRNKSSSTSSSNATSAISINDSVASLNDSNEMSVSGRSSRNQSKHSTSVISNNDNLTLLNTTMESLKSNESHKTQSKHSISPTSYNKSLKLTNSTAGSSGRRSSSRNKSSSTSSSNATSAISKNDSVTLLIDSKEISVGGRSLRNKSKHSTSVISNPDRLPLVNTATMESLESNESPKTQSKRSISPTSYNESLKSTNSTTGSPVRRTLSRNKSSTSSKHSTSANPNNDSVTLLNDSKEISIGDRSLRNQSKHSKSVILNNDNLTLLNTTMESLKTKGSRKRQSKRSLSPTSYNESLKSTNSTTGFSGSRSSSRNKSSLLTSKHSTSVISNSDGLTSLNATTEISVGNRLSQHSTCVISNHGSLPLFNPATMGFSESKESPKTQSTSPTLNIDNLTTLNTTTESLKQNVFSINGSISKHSSLINSEKTSIDTLMLGDVINNVSKMSTRSSKRKSNCSGNVKPITSIIIDGLSNSDGLTIKNTTTGPLEQKILSINQLNSSPNISTKTSNNGLILEDDTNNISKMYASSSKQKNKSYDDIEQLMPNITDGPLVENRPSKTRVLRSSRYMNKNKSLPTKSLTSENDVDNLSIGSTRTSKHMANFNNETFDNNSDNSLFWTTLPDESTNISSIKNVNMNTFQTPKRNKLSIAENIVNTIKIMSTNKRKSTHPGAFELDDHNDGPRSLVTRSRSCNRSPSILTVVFGRQKTSESTSSFTQSPSEIIFDESQVEDNVKQKFKSLYKKEYWITKRLYKFLIIKLQPNYNIYSVKYAEKFVKYLAQSLKQILKDKVNLQLYTDMLRYHMARYHIIKDTFDYIGFLCDYIPMEYYKKLVPGWNLETSAVKFDPQKYYVPLMEDEEFLNYIMEHLNEA